MRIDDDFVDAVRAAVSGVPAGDVVTYGEIAAEIGRPGQARAVGRVLAMGEPGVPWWRVVNAAGRLVPGVEPEHRHKLLAEGVVLDDRGVVGMRRRRRR